jgi:hypothetical protein
MVYQRHVGRFLVFPVYGVWFSLQDFPVIPINSVAFFVLVFVTPGIGRVRPKHVLRVYVGHNARIETLHLDGENTHPLKINKSESQ